MRLSHAPYLSCFSFIISNSKDMPAFNQFHSLPSSANGTETNSVTLPQTAFTIFNNTLSIKCIATAGPVIFPVLKFSPYFRCCPVRWVNKSITKVSACLGKSQRYPSYLHGIIALAELRREISSLNYLTIKSRYFYWRTPAASLYWHGTDVFLNVTTQSKWISVFKKLYDRNLYLQYDGFFLLAIRTQLSSVIVFICIPLVDYSMVTTRIYVVKRKEGNIPRLCPGYTVRRQNRLFTDATRASRRSLSCCKTGAFA